MLIYTTLRPKNSPSILIKSKNYRSPNNFNNYTEQKIGRKQNGEQMEQNDFSPSKKKKNCLRQRFPNNLNNN